MQELARRHDVTTAQVEKEFFEKARPSSLLKRFEKPEEVAAVVAFVASHQGAVINGAALRAEGGLVRSALKTKPPAAVPEIMPASNPCRKIAPTRHGASPRMR